jgi:hypothetical protein
VVACRRFIALGDNIDVERVDFDSATDAPSGLGGDRVDPEPEAEPWLFYMSGDDRPLV